MVQWGWTFSTLSVAKLCPASCFYSSFRTLFFRGFYLLSWSLTAPDCSSSRHLTLALGRGCFSGFVWPLGLLTAGQGCGDKWPGWIASERAFISCQRKGIANRVSKSAGNAARCPPPQPEASQPPRCPRLPWCDSWPQGNSWR